MLTRVWYLFFNDIKMYSVSKKFKLFKVYSNIPFSQKSYRLENSQPICNANQLNGFYLIQVFPEKYF